MARSSNPAQASALRLLEDLPGIADVVWATVTRLASAGSPTSVLFTAAEQRAGTSVLACATAIGLAQHERVPVCLLETNVRRPALAGYLGLESAGLSDVLDGRAELDDCLQEARDCEGLFVLPAGTPRAPVSGEFTTDRLTSILARLADRCHYLVLDAAPVLDHAESRLLLRHADGVLLVLRARATRRSDAERALDILVESGTPVLGSIFNAYKSESLFGVNGRANRSFASALRTARRRASVVSSALLGEAASVEIAESAAERESSAAATDGGLAIEARASAEERSGVAYLQQIDLLERRIGKLTQQLEQTEADLKKLAAMKNVDLGIASISRSAQALASDEDKQAFRRSLMEQIFLANLGLKAAMAQHT